jgi:uncharacterized protein
MLPDLPQSIEPLRLVRLGAHLAGNYPIRAMERLKLSLYDDSGVAEFTLEFRRDAEGQPAITGTISADLNAVCQRCLQQLRITVRSNVSLGVVTSHETARVLPPQYEPLLVGESPLPLIELIEDELILALPMVTMHRQEDCPAASLTAQDPGTRYRPFAGLNRLGKSADS